MELIVFIIASAVIISLAITSAVIKNPVLGIGASIIALIAGIVVLGSGLTYPTHETVITANGDDYTVVEQTTTTAWLNTVLGMMYTMLGLAFFIISVIGMNAGKNQYKDGSEYS
jgi:hypothetical protein